MTHKPLKSVPVLLVVMLALSIALVGTATVGNAAASITKAQVKKIAKKAVKKAAPTLSVASAQTAANATLLGGQPASAYQSPTYTYSLPSQALAVTRTYAFPGLPPGKYIVSWTALLQNGTATKHNCYMRQNGLGRDGWAYSSPGYSAGFAGVGASFYIDSSTTVPTLRCESDGTWTVYGSDTLNRVAFVRVDPVTNGTSTASRGVTGTDGSGTAGRP